jgi:hypothetical protein
MSAIFVQMVLLKIIDEAAKTPLFLDPLFPVWGYGLMLVIFFAALFATDAINFYHKSQGGESG